MRAITGTWLQPAAFFPLWWCIAGIFPLMLAPREPVAPIAMAWIFGASVAVSIGAIVGNGGARTRRAAVALPGTHRELVILGTVLLLSIVLGVASSAAFVLSSGFALSDLLDIERLVVVSNQAYIARYAETGAPAPPALSQALLPFVYLAPAVGGIVFELRRDKLWKFAALFALLPAITVTIVQTTKAALLFGGMFWLSGYFAARLRQGKISVFTKGHLLAAAVVGGIVTAFFFAVSLARMASTDLSLVNLVLAKLVTAAFGHMTVFSQWLTEYWAQPIAPTLGTVTFAGPLDMIGFSHRIPGIFENVIDLVIGESSNIYTAFRPLIQDFTIPGALAILALLGFVGGVGFRKVAAGQWSALPLLSAVYLTTFCTPIAWFWIYNSLTATVLVLAVLVWFISLLRGRHWTPSHMGDPIGNTAGR